MQLDYKETALVNAFRRLPADTANELSALMQRLAALPSTSTIDWSDSWSDQDLREFAAHSLKRVEEEEEEES